MMDKSAEWIRLRYLKELTIEEKAALDKIIGEWCHFKGDSKRVFFIKKLNGELIVCDEYLKD
jgi:hypothetical protein